MWFLSVRHNSLLLQELIPDFSPLHSKDLALELPIWIAHPRSLPPAAHAHQHHYQNRIPTSLPLHPPFPGSQRAISPIEPSYSYPFAPPPPAQYTDFGATNHYVQAPATFPMSASTPALQHYGQGPLISPSYYPQAPFFPPPPTPPFEQGHSSPNPAPYYIAFDPTVPDLTQSRFLHSLQQQQAPQSYIPAESTFTVPFGRPPSADSLQPITMSPVPTLSPAPAFYSPDVNGRSSPDRPLSSRGFRPHEEIPAFAGMEGVDNQSERDQIRANVAPLQPYSAQARADMTKKELQATLVVRRNTAPVFDTTPLPIPQAVSNLIRPDHLVHKSQSMGSINRPNKTPPPPAPSSRFAPSRTPSPAIRPGLSFPSIDDGLLDTIGEDGESQAGTTKSMVELAKLLKNMGDDDDEVRSIGIDQSPGRNSVSDLEDFVEQQERSFEMDKTLPKPPVPTGKEWKPQSSGKGLMRAQDIFAPIDERTITASPIDSKLRETPPLNIRQRTASLPPPSSAAGLSALEARLSRPSTPEISSLPHIAFPVTSTIRTMSPPSDNSPASNNTNFRSGALRAKSLSRATSERSLRKMLEDVEPAEAVRKALEAKRKEEFAPALVAPLRLGSKSPTLALASPAIPLIEPRSTTAFSFDKPYIDGRKVVDPVETKGLKRDAAARVSDWMKTEVMSPPVSTSSNSSGVKAVRRSTFDFVRTAPPPPPPSTSPVLARSSSFVLLKPESTTMERAKSDAPLNRSTFDISRSVSTRSLKNTASVVTTAIARPIAIKPPPSPSAPSHFPASKAEEPRKKVAPVEPSMEDLLKAESAGGVDGARVQRDGRACEEFGARYDVKSARGGKGGIVSSVASKWGDMLGSEEVRFRYPLMRLDGLLMDNAQIQSSKKSRAPLPSIPKVFKNNSDALNISPPRINSNSGGDIYSPPASPTKSSSGRISSRPTNLPTRSSATKTPTVLKRWSEPAFSTTAKPFVNTTMGKAPVLVSGARVSSSSSTSNSSSGAASRGGSPVIERGENALEGREQKKGIRELIARYQ